MYLNPSYLKILNLTEFQACLFRPSFWLFGSAAQTIKQSQSALFLGHPPFRSSIHLQALLFCISTKISEVKLKFKQKKLPQREKTFVIYSGSFYWLTLLISCFHMFSMKKIGNFLSFVAWLQFHNTIIPMEVGRNIHPQYTLNNSFFFMVQLTRTLPMSSHPFFYALEDCLCNQTLQPKSENLEQSTRYIRNRTPTSVLWLLFRSCL